MRLSEHSLSGMLAAHLAEPPGKAVSLVWLGQAGFVLDGGGQRLVIDAYLSDSLAEKYRGTRFPHARMMPAPAAPGEIAHVTAVLATHAHTDHLDPGTLPALLAANPGAVLVAPASATGTAVARSGVAPERLRSIDAGESLTLAPGLTVTATRAAHEALETDAQGRHRFLGIAVRIGGATVFHSGDTVPFEGQVEEVRALGAALALLPVNGRDEARRANGVPGNMTGTEAVALARGAGIPAVIAHHFDLFDFNTVPRSEVEALASRTRDLHVAPARVGVLYRLEEEAP
jgi:L-ascorbate metabolism protein UlaG (beta-lactamase superfamily)